MSAIVRKVIRVDGTEEQLLSPVSISEASRLINADTLDTVLLRDRLHVMLVDDTGMLAGLPVNEKATALYHQVCRPGTTAQIHGDVVIVPDSDFGSDI